MEEEETLLEHEYAKLCKRAVDKNSALLAIRAKCWDCGGGSWVEVRNCHITTCALYPFRLGKLPRARGKGEKSDK